MNTVNKLLLSVKNMLRDIILGVNHFIMSSVLLFIALRAYLRTKLPSILYYFLGFAIIATGHVVIDIFFYNNVRDVEV